MTEHEQPKTETAMTEEQIEEVVKPSAATKKLRFNLIRAETKQGLVRLGSEGLCWYFEVEGAKEDDPYGGIAVTSALVAAMIAAQFAEIAEALKMKEEENAIKNAETPKKPLSAVKSYKERLQ